VICQNQKKLKPKIFSVSTTNGKQRIKQQSNGLVLILTYPFLNTILVVIIYV